MERNENKDLEKWKSKSKKCLLEFQKGTTKKIGVGLFAGIVSGLFSAGGGMIVVPALIHIFKLEDSKARATSVFAILPMVIASGLFYYKNNYIDWNIGIKCAVGGIVGGYIGSRLLKKISDKILRILFTAFLIYVSIKMMLSN